jgi:hypothetical protein
MSDQATVDGAPREISGMGVLDLTGMSRPEELANISSIHGVGTILVPKSLSGRLAAIPMHGVGSVVPVPDGENVKPRVLVGSVQLSGEALANPQGEGLHILVVVGGLVVTSPVEKVGYDQVVVVGHVLAPEGSCRRLWRNGWRSCWRRGAGSGRWLRRRLRPSGRLCWRK